MELPFLLTGDTIGICATARWITPDQLQPALDILHAWGFKTKVMPQVFDQEGQLAGADQSRIDGFMQCLTDPEVKAILIARGGYGTVRVVDAIPEEAILKNRKWLCGYSDVTVLHNQWNNLGLPTIHSTMPISFPSATTLALDQLHRALTGNWNTRSWNGSFTDEIIGEGQVVGGNASVIYSQLGSLTQLKTEGKYLFLEDVDEMLYHMDRMLMGFSRAGLLNGIKGLLIGGMTQMKDNTEEFGFSTHNPWGKSIQDIVKGFAKKHNVGVAFDFPAGHWEQNEAFYFNKNIRIKKVVDNSATLSMELISN